MKYKYPNIQYANSLIHYEFAQWKQDIFDLVSQNFLPVKSEDGYDSYVFYIDKCKWRFGHAIKDNSWVFIIEREVVLNKYGKEDPFYIKSRGFNEKFRTYYNGGEEFEECLNDEVEQIKTKLNQVIDEMKQGTRKIIYPKNKQFGYITRKNYLSGLDDEGRAYEWSLKFSDQDIPFLLKEPTIEILTGRKYLKLCHLFYQSNPKRFKDVPNDPKQAFIKFADSRTKTIADVDLDDPQDLYDWLKKQGKWQDRKDIGHICEIDGRLFLWPIYTNGFSGYYQFHCSFVWLNDYAARLCREPNVKIYDNQRIAEIIKGNGKLRVVDVFFDNRYAYPNKDYDEPVAYDELSLKQKRRVIWDELKESPLKGYLGAD